MNAVWFVAGAWGLFAATHLALGLPPWRDRLARRLGEQRFVALFSAVAAASLATLAAAVALHGGSGPPASTYGSDPAAVAALGILAWLGIVLATAGLLNYLRSPMALFRTQLRPPAGIERVTRHAFFVGLSLFAVAHALLAHTLATSVYFAGFAALAIVGALLQDRKLLRRHGAAYGDYLAATSLVPFAALLRGRQRLPPGEGLLRRVSISALVAVLVFALHPFWSALHGAPLAGVIAIGGVAAAARRWNLARGRMLPSDSAASVEPVGRESA